MRHLLLSTLLALSVSSAFAADVEETKPIPKCTPSHVPIVLKTKDGKTITALVKKKHAEDLKNAHGLEAAHDIFEIQVPRHFFNRF